MKFIPPLPLLKHFITEDHQHNLMLQLNKKSRGSIHFILLTTIQYNILLLQLQTDHCKSDIRYDSITNRTATQDSTVGSTAISGYW